MKKISLFLILAVCLGTLVACGNNSKKEETKSLTTNEKTPQEIAFMKDINQKNERVWLCLEHGDKFNKDARVGNAIHVKEGKVEVVDVSKKLRDLDEIEDDALWNYLVKENQKQFTEEKAERLVEAKRQIEATTNFLKKFKEGYDSFDGTPKEVAEDSAKTAKEFKENLESVETIKPTEVEPKVLVETDSTGNKVIKETIDLKHEDRATLFLFNTAYSRGEFTYIPTGDMRILNRDYVAYQGEDDVLVTRKAKGASALQFDKVDEKGVKEVSSSN